MIDQLLATIERAGLRGLLSFVATVTASNAVAGIHSLDDVKHLAMAGAIAGIAAGASVLHDYAVRLLGGGGEDS